MFSEIQSSLLRRVRDRIKAGRDNFICCAINELVQEVSEISYHERFDAGRRLKDEIEYGIDHYTCFELWLFSETGIHPDDLSKDAREAWNKRALSGWTTPVSRTQFNNWCRLARLAWIDRSLERGEML